MLDDDEEEEAETDGIWTEVKVEESEARVGVCFGLWIGLEIGIGL